jgi:anti-sigma regulatory factor (Ser/Thr protein kinase)
MSMVAVVHPWYFETDTAADALAGRPALERYLGDHTSGDPFVAALVYGELISNVVKYAPRGGVRVWLEPHGERFALCISDAGEGFTESIASMRPPDPLAESGRGLFLVHAFCEQVSYGKNGEGFVVRAVLPLRRL